MQADSVFAVVSYQLGKGVTNVEELTFAVHYNRGCDLEIVVGMPVCTHEMSLTEAVYPAS